MVANAAEVTDYVVPVYAVDLWLGSIERLLRRNAAARRLCLQEGEPYLARLERSVRESRAAGRVARMRGLLASA